MVPADLPEPDDWGHKLLGGVKALAIWWRLEPDSDFEVRWRLYQNAETAAQLVATDVLTPLQPVCRINLQPVFNDPNISNGEILLRFQGDVCLCCDIPLGRSTWHNGPLQCWPAQPPEPDPDEPPPDPFDPSDDDLGHRRLAWGAQIEPSAERLAVLDFVWFDALAPGEDRGRFAAFADGGGDAANLQLVQDFATAIAGKDPAAALAAIQQAAQAFIAKTWPLAPAPQALASGLEQLTEAIARLEGEQTLADLDDVVLEVLGLDSADFNTQQIEPPDGLYSTIWQLIYAEVAAAPMPSGGPVVAEVVAAMRTLARTARSMSLVARIAQGDLELCDSVVRERLRHALLVLPSGVVPPAPAGSATVDCLGVGVQKTVDQRLAAYRLGEIADVVNIMPGERLTLVDRDRQQTRESETEATRESRDDTRDERWSNTGDLAQDLRDALSQTEVIRDYTGLTVDPATWPDLSVSGSWWGEDGSQARAVGRAARFVEAVSSGVANRVATEVVRRRSRLTLRDHESTQTRRIDNSASAAPVRGVYHWLEKVYELRLRSLGRRLVIEFLLTTAAERLRRKTELWPHLAPVLAPQTWGIPSDPAGYAKVTAANAACAAAAYGMELSPPPATSAVVRVRMTAQNRSAMLVVPPGFSAASVSMSYVVSDASLPIVALIAETPVSFTPTTGAVGSSGQIAANLATMDAAASAPPSIADPLTFAWAPTVPGSGAGSATFANGLTGEAPLVCQYEGANFSLVAEAQCTDPTDRLTPWQIASHRAILSAYDNARAAHEAALFAAIAGQASEGVGRLISKQLTLAALDALALAVPRPSAPAAVAGADHRR